jgi:hypothetical protein
MNLAANLRRQWLYAGHINPDIRAAWAATILFSGDLAAHVGLNELKVIAGGFPIASGPSGVIGIGMPNLKQNNCVAHLATASQPVGDACHDSGPRCGLIG